MAHPQQRTHAIDTLRLEYGAIRLVTDDLAEGDPILDVRCAAITLVEQRDKGFASLRTLVGKVVQAIVKAERPKRVLGHHEAHAFDGRDGGGANLGV